LGEKTWATRSRSARVELALPAMCADSETAACCTATRYWPVSHSAEAAVHTCGGNWSATSDGASGARFAATSSQSARTPSPCSTARIDLRAGLISIGWVTSPSSEGSRLLRMARTVGIPTVSSVVSARARSVVPARFHSARYSSHSFLQASSRSRIHSLFMAPQVGGERRICGGPGLGAQLAFLDAGSMR
jgi:hypothetical protein